MNFLQQKCLSSRTCKILICLLGLTTLIYSCKHFTDSQKEDLVMTIDNVENELRDLNNRANSVQQSISEERNILKETSALNERVEHIRLSRKYRKLIATMWHYFIYVKELTSAYYNNYDGQRQPVFSRCSTE